MNTSKKVAQITDAEYKRLLENVEEIEKLIVAARKSCEAIERLRCPTAYSLYKSYHIQVQKIKKIRKNVFGQKKY